VELLIREAVQPARVADALALVPPEELGGVSAEQALACWRHWASQGALGIGWVRAGESASPESVQCVGVTLWVADAAVEAMTGPGPTDPKLVYQRSDAWVMDRGAIRSAHAQRRLSLLVLHFWARPQPGDPDFMPVFEQSSSLFKELHQGFGVQRVLQQVPADRAGLLAMAGFRSVRTEQADARGGSAARTMMLIDADAACSNPGTWISFLFMSPPARLGLGAAAQRMLTLALEQHTDDDIARLLGCSRDYVRKLWNEAYEALEDAGVLIKRHRGGRGQDDAGASRGRERRRQALNHLRHNLQELRPGLSR
jgi:biotin operon repressor